MRQQAARDADDARARFVWVEADRSARELTPNECTYLAMPYEAMDIDRPYINPSYDAPGIYGDGSGFLARADLPPSTRVRPRTDFLALALRREKWRVVGQIPGVIAMMVIAVVLGWLAMIVGGFIALAFRGGEIRVLGILLFILGVMYGAAVWFVGGLLGMMMTTDRSRFLRFFALTGIYFGFFAGAAWVLWWHGVPARLIPFGQ